MAGIIALSIWTAVLSVGCVYLAFRCAKAEAQLESQRSPIVPNKEPLVLSLPCSTKDGSICELHRQPLRDGVCQISGYYLSAAEGKRESRKPFPSPRTFVTGSQYVQQKELESLKDFKEA